MVLLSWQSAWGSNYRPDLCEKFVRIIVQESEYTWGLNAEWWTVGGQIEHESACKEWITAPDEGRGLGQFMDATAKILQKREPRLQELSIQPCPYDPAWSIRAVVLFDNWLMARTSCPGWYFILRAYNGGFLINKEIARAGSCNIKSVEACCRRKLQPLDMCKINISYPITIGKLAKKWRKRYVYP
jgi:hypothetical protein